MVAGAPYPKFMWGMSGTGTISFGQKQPKIYPTPPPARKEPVPPVVTTVDYNAKTSAWGSIITISAGRRRLPSYLIWVQGNSVQKTTVDSVETFKATYACSFGYPLDTKAAGRVVTKIWADGRRLWANADGATSGTLDGGATWTFYRGSETQLQNALMVADNGAQYTPAYRGQMYMVIENMPLDLFNDTIPSISAEVVDSDYLETRMTVLTQIKMFAIKTSGFLKRDILSDGVDNFKNDGIVINNNLSLKDVLDVLARFYGFDYLETAGTLKLSRRSDNGAYTLDGTITEDMLLRDESGPIVKTTREEDANFPVAVEIGYIDRSQQYRDNSQRARRPGFPVKPLKSDVIEQFKVPVIITATEAMTGASRALYRDSAQKVTHEFKLGPGGLAYEPGDIVALNTRVKNYVVKLTSVTLNGDLSMDCEAVSLAVNEDDEDVTGYAGEAGDYVPPWTIPEEPVLEGDIVTTSPPLSIFDWPAGLHSLESGPTALSPPRIEQSNEFYAITVTQEDS